MREKLYSQYLLRALDGEDLRLDVELGGLVVLGNRVRGTAPEISGLSEDARRRIWNGAVSQGRELTREATRGRLVPRLAWAAAALAAAALITILAIVLVGGGGPVPWEPGNMSMLFVERGEVTIRDVQGEERKAGDDEVIEAGDTILASADAQCIVEFESGCIMRLYGEGEVGFAAGEEGLVAEVARGQTYHRVVEGARYTARATGVSVAARGTAFTFDVRGEAGKIISVQSAVEVTLDAAEIEGLASQLEQGDVLIYGGPEGPRVQEVTLEDLDSEWLRWNKSLDEALGLPVGELSRLDEAVADGEPPEPQAPTGEEGEQPAPQPQPSPAPAPTPTPTPPVEKSVSLTGSARAGAVDFSWTVTGYSGYQGFKLCRSETNPSPSYPGDWWMYVDGAASRSATDTSVQAGHTYYYRLAVYNAGDVLGYSNAVQVTVPGAPAELSITLSATAASGKISLSWDVSGGGTYSGFKVCRSETNPSPAYPGDTCTYVDASARSFTDTGVTSGHTYYYRVGIYKDGTIIKYSNAVKVTVP
ncbi:MAG: fibronectin type III domain-containing protein [Actinomycetota bacterium]